ncbi:MAG: VWA domain-containing protein [Gammaproteobacteria bacterium]|nr:MAG: VWA domain-containing protein [Gammaproteobacteria bacterium]
MLTFAHPWLFLLIPLPGLIRKLLPAHHQRKAAVRVPFMQRLSQRVGQQPGSGVAVAKRSLTQWLVLGLAWLLVVAAIARPQWLEEPIIKELPMRDLLVAVDLSGSMEARDFTDTDGDTVDRLTAVKQVLDAFFARRDGDRVGLILFGSAAYVQVPFTSDLEVIRELLDEAQIRMLGPRTMLGDAMGLAINLFERSEVDERVLIVLTDGNDTGSLVPPERAAEIARDNGVVIYTIAIGDPTAVGEQALDEKALENIAATTGGAYFHANDTEELEAIYAHLDEINPRQVEIQSYRPLSDLYSWPLAAAMLLTLLYVMALEVRLRYFNRQLESLMPHDGAS